MAAAFCEAGPLKPVSVGPGIPPKGRSVVSGVPWGEHPGILASRPSARRALLRIHVVDDNVSMWLLEEMLLREITRK